MIIQPLQFGTAENNPLLSLNLNMICLVTLLTFHPSTQFFNHLSNSGWLCARAYSSFCGVKGGPHPGQVASLLKAEQKRTHTQMHRDTDAHTILRPPLQGAQSHKSCHSFQTSLAFACLLCHSDSSSVHKTGEPGLSAALSSPNVSGERCARECKYLIKYV